MEVLARRRPPLSIVLDSSITLAWIFSDETSDAIRQIFESVAGSGAVAPALWRLEVANGLTMALRRKRIDARFRRAALADLTLLDMAIDRHTDARAWAETLELADRFRLTMYDAAYLELAQRRSLPLATLDNELRGAAKSLGVERRPG
jgi:predicted nucleic acid-binding protein